MKIAIDARLLGPEGKGIGRYIEKLLENLEQLDKENQYYVVLKNSNFHLYSPKRPNFQKVTADAREYSFKEQFLIPAILAKIKPDLVHFPHFNVPLLYPGKFVVTIHDLIPSEFKESNTPTKSIPIALLKQFGYEVSIRQAVSRAAKIFTPSKFINHKLQKAFSLPKGKLITTYEAADENFLEIGKQKISLGKEKKILNTYGVRKPFVLFVGNAFPHKNLEILVEAISLTKKLDFVYVGERNSFSNKLVDKARQFGVENRLIMTGFVTNEDLPYLYKLARCYVFPSLSEGFGLPGLEAMAAGCPVAASNIEVFKEIYGQAPLYFNPKKPEDIAEKINQVAENREQRAQLRKKGFEQVKKYSWQKMAQETLKIYKEASLQRK